MQVRCPQCHAPVELASDEKLSDIACPSCGSSFSLLADAETMPYEAGTKTIGHFDLVEKIGVGTFGFVWKARDTELDRTVAIKIPRKGQLDPDETEQFLREARAAAQLRHPGIVSVHEVGRDQDTVFIVSDFVDGTTLADRLTAQRFSFREAAELCAKIADALHHAHEHGVIHRDLKPGNVILDAAGRAAHHGLRAGTARGGRSHDDRRGTGAGHARVHVARAGEGVGAHGRSAERCVFAGSDPVRDADGRATVSRQCPHAGASGDQRRAAESEAAEWERATGSGDDLPEVPGETPTSRYATAKDLADELRRFWRESRSRPARLGI